MPTPPPTAMAVVSRPNPTSSMPSRSTAYRTRTDQAAPYVTLKVKIVRARVRIGGWGTSQRMASALPGPERGRQQVVRQQEGALHPGVRDAEVLAGHETRDERAAGRVGERLRRAEDEEGDEDDGDVDRPRDEP